MKRESKAVLLRIFIGESAQHEGKPLYKVLVELFRREKLAGCTVLRGVDGFGRSSHVHTTSILRLSTDLPMVVEAVDTRENIERIKPLLDGVVTNGLITEEEITTLFYDGGTAPEK